MKKALALALCIVLCTTALISGTVAFFTDEESQVNVFEVGYVDIIQHEKTRPDNAPDGELDDYDNTNPPKLFPLVEKDMNKPTTVPRDFDDTTVQLVNPEHFGGYIDKIVTVENEGKNAAYLRNIVAVPTGGTDAKWLNVHFGDAKNPDAAIRTIDWEKANGQKNPEVENVEINGALYDIYVFNYIGEDDGKFQPGDTTVPTLLGFWMDKSVNFEEKVHKASDGKYYDIDGRVVANPILQDDGTPAGAYYYPLENGNREYISLEGIQNHIYVASQAVQADGFASFDQAFQNSFNGPISGTNHPWYTGSSDPADPSDPANPNDPADPTNPSDPADPADPTNPSDPADPADPVVP